MDNNQIIDNQFEQLDFIFIGVKLSKKISLEELFKKYELDFNVMKIGMGDLDSILNSMVTGGKILKNSDGTYIVNPLNPEFISFKYEYLRNKSVERKTKNFDIFLKLLPVFFSIIFGAIATIVSISNLLLTQKKTNENKIVLTIDSSLKSELTQKLDSIKLKKK